MIKKSSFISNEYELTLSQRVQLLHEHLLTSLPMALVCASIIFYGLFNNTNNSLIISWYLTIVSVFLLRFYFFKLYRNNPQKCALHLKLFIIGSTLSAILWGVAGTLLMPPGRILDQAIIIVIIAGVSSGSVQTLQASPVASILYVIFSVFPLDIWLAAQRTQTYFLLSMSIFLYIIFILIVCKRGHQLIMSSLALRFENMSINTQLETINRMLKAEIIKHKKNEKSLAQLAEIVRHSKDAIIGLDTDGIIQTWNKGAEALYGYSAQQMMGKSITALTPASQKDILESMLKKVVFNLSFQNTELERQNNAGHLIPVSVTLSPIINDSGKIIGISSMDRDISERKEIDKVKNEFISVVSHELRTPLTSIKGSIGLLLHKKDTISNEQMTQLLDIAYQNCDRLIRLINDILDIEKIESGKINFKFDKINLRKLLLNSIEENKSYADKYQVSVILINNDDIIIDGDYDRLMQVMSNLISNAVKFSYPETLVEINMIQQDDHVTVLVTDHGMGIPTEFQDKIFGKFTQADASSTRNKGGTGLGLSISQAILEKHHSVIHFTSQEGHGATFYFDLPLSYHITS